MSGAEFHLSNPIEFHPLTGLFPLLEGDQFDDLVADIREHGLHEPIVLYDGLSEWTDQVRAKRLGWSCRGTRGWRRSAATAPSRRTLSGLCVRRRAISMTIRSRFERTHHDLAFFRHRTSSRRSDPA